MNDKQHEALHKISVQYERANGHEIMSYCPLDNRVGNALVNMGFARRSHSKYRGKYSYQITDKGAQKIGFRDLADMLAEDDQPAQHPTSENEPRSPAGGGSPTMTDKPHAGEIYQKSCFRRLNVRVLVLSYRGECSTGWFVYGLPVYDGAYGMPMMLVIERGDTALDRVRLPECGKLALKQYRAIQRVNRKAYVEFDGCERDGYYFARGI